jgi:prevent-host-death family protein
VVDIVTFTEAQNNLKSVLDEVVDDANVTIIARRYAPNAVVMSLDTYNSIMETSYRLRMRNGWPVPSSNTGQVKPLSRH